MDFGQNNEALIKNFQLMDQAPKKSSTIEYIENVLKKGVDTIKDASWAIGVSALFIAYPIAISVLDDRFILSKSKI